MNLKIKYIFYIFTEYSSVHTDNWQYFEQKYKWIYWNELMKIKKAQPNGSHHVQKINM